jgi:hypothetical protein
LFPRLSPRLFLRAVPLRLILCRLCGPTNVNSANGRTYMRRESKEVNTRT